MISGKMYRMHVSRWVDPSFAEAWLLSTEAQKAIDRMKTGGSDSGLNLTHSRFLQLPFLVAPLAEQHRIVAKVEDLFAKLDSGVSALRRAREKLERYRTSVLKAAVEGRLTEQWRKENPPKESGEELVGRTLAERQKRWEDERLAMFEAKGKRPSKNWKKQYKEPVGPDSSKLPELPEGWHWATLPQLGDFGRGKSKHRPRGDPALYGGDYPFVQTKEVARANGWIRHHTKTYNQRGLSQSKLWPQGLCALRSPPTSLRLGY